MSTFIGCLPIEQIIPAIAHVAALRRLNAEDLTKLDDEGWRDLTAAAFGAGQGCVRLGVICAMVEEQEQRRGVA